MFCRRLSLANFRSYPRLDLELPPRLSLFWGDNGQGKSNLLEALYLLATTRSYRTSSERELVNWHADTQPVFARAAAEVVRHHTTTRIEIVLAEPPAGAAAPAATPGQRGEGRPAAVAIRRRGRVNGHEKQLVEVIGHLNAVLFSPEDVELIAGAAEVRRRYLYITLSQVDHRYLRTLRRYQRVLQQRNALLREMRERPGRPEQMEFWDEEVTALGAELTVAHVRALAFLNQHLAEVHPQLTSDPAPLRAAYRSSLDLGADPDDLGASAAGSDEAAVLAHVRQRMTTGLAELRLRERQQAVTLVGPHRDDVVFFVGDVDLRLYGSRGQQRTAALALKLAEVALMQRYTDERPILLLDDVMSELDPRRRALLQEMVVTQDQVLLTATDLSFFSESFLAGARRFRVTKGAVTPDS